MLGYSFRLSHESILIAIFDLATSNNEIIQSRAITALANNQNDSLHDLAIQLINKQPESIKNGVLKLFIKNYHSGDFHIIESALNISHDLETKHYVGFDLIKIIKTQKNSELTNCAFWVYENTPCSSHCRRSIVEILINLKQITPDIIEECLSDCSLEIRDLVASIT